MTRTTSELVPLYPNFCATPTGRRLATTYAVACNRPHRRWIFSGIGFRTCDPPASALGEMWPLDKVPGLVPGSKPDPTEDPKYMLRVKRFLIGVVGQLGEGALAQAPPSSSDRGSKLRGPSQNSPRVASKWHVNIAKLRHLLTCY
ncbi:hypothetical protein AVEN_232455-1 [Araneus ventricosus]|uniref:Uncharacterized protein n=1 Tax=Araneus ventricosus TaxID=182803 RepID=A0A4Y2EAE3_ARAVE|nr:hypothetical protein AVEN_232455-1 [Araneus ventricosus]